MSWQAKKQPTVALSSVEAEYMAATQSTKEALWWRTFLSEIGIITGHSTNIDHVQLTSVLSTYSVILKVVLL